MNEESSLDVHVRKSQELLQALMARPNCSILVELVSLRSQGWESETLDGVFLAQRTTADTNRSPRDDARWLQTMCKSLRQMDRQKKFIMATRFLDLGCFPGGYSTYILQKCPLATGLGISLPFEEGGHGLAIPAKLLPRMELRTADLTNFDLAPSIPKPQAPFTQLGPLSFESNSFDLVVCDGHSLRNNPDNIDRPWNWTRLLVSQLLMGLRAVSDGGTIFIKLSHLEKAIGARILLALCQVARPVQTVKPQPLHAIRGTFYVIAQQVSTNSAAYQTLVQSLERLWYIMSFEGECGYGREITWEEEDMIIDWVEVMSERGLNQLARLGAEVWRIQCDALRKMLNARGIGAGEAQTNPAAEEHH
ncbi:ribosomal RNA large subunit methyltransferase J [Rhizoctonia solani AG-3 Rhs1AP]|uniref:Ribosomal RNA large subunit methyltransferase J n=2 Tax=Rhizoctonia solani AG-3 TaxID=1086053 RepID=A0A074SSK0_9AGAM|nr:ribosomal RNA large subunit methyltransferase J [Rhizoctonia solani AG-3 Rhs1AP]KEP52942.1 ribosomal RNA large subunit methyltransferase J [Rhizoctonia solani 123E]